MGYFPGKQTATPSKPKTQTTSGGGGGGSSPTPYNVSPALRSDVRAAREAANVAAGVTSKSGGGGGSYVSGSVIQGTPTKTDYKVSSSSKVLPTTPVVVSKYATPTAREITQSVPLMTSPALRSDVNTARLRSNEIIAKPITVTPVSTFRRKGGSALISKSYVKNGANVTEYYGSVGEQVAARRKAKAGAVGVAMKAFETQERSAWIRDLTQQQRYSQNLRGKVPLSDQGRAEMQASLRKPRKFSLPGNVYTVQVDSKQFAEQMEKRDRPFLYYAKQYGKGAIEGVAGGLGAYYLGSRAVYTAGGTVGVVSGAPFWAGAALAGGAVAGGGAVYDVTKRNIGLGKTFYEGFKEGGVKEGFGAIGAKEIKRARSWKAFGNKYSGEIVRGVAAVTTSIPSYISAQKFYGAKPIATSVQKGSVVRKGYLGESTAKQKSRVNFMAGDQKYAVKVRVTSKESIRPGLTSSSQDKVVYDVFKVGKYGKLSKIKTVVGSGEAQIKPSGEFIRFEKVGGGRTRLTVGNIYRVGKEGGGKFGYGSTTSRISGFKTTKESTTLGYVERTRGVSGFKIDESWSVKSVSKPVVKPKTKIKLPVGKKGQVAISRPKSTFGYGSTRVKPIYEPVVKSVSKIKGTPALNLDIVSGSGKAVRAAVGGSIGLSPFVVGTLIGGGSIYTGLPKSSVVSVARPTSLATARSVSKTVSYSTPDPIVQITSFSETQPVSLATSEPLVRTIVRPQTTVPFTTPFSFLPPELPPVPGLAPFNPDLQFLRGRRRRSVLKSQRKAYVPSLVAAEFNIRSSKPPGKLSGFEIRPLPKKRKRFKLI